MHFQDLRRRDFIGTQDPSWSDHWGRWIRTHRRDTTSHFHHEEGHDHTVASRPHPLIPEWEMNWEKCWWKTLWNLCDRREVTHRRPHLHLLPSWRHFSLTLYRESHVTCSLPRNSAKHSPTDAFHRILQTQNRRRSWERERERERSNGQRRVNGMKFHGVPGWDDGQTEVILDTLPLSTTIMLHNKNTRSQGSIHFSLTLSISHETLGFFPANL